VRIVVAILIALVLVVIVQNTSVVTLHFLLWNASLSLVLVLLFTALAGFLAGYLLGRLGRGGGDEGAP
jgi:uncharacterized integral membrane protein